jgi:hypothetical protein
MNDALRREVEELRKQKTAVLKIRYRELFGEESRSSNHAHLFRRIAWRLQAAAEGDLSARALERAAELAGDAELGLRAPGKFWRDLSSESPKPDSRDDRLPAPGTLVTREFQGRLITATVLKDRFEFEGRTYDSLSAIASKVTGTRWNGYSFFGLSLRAASRRAWPAMMSLSAPTRIGFVQPHSRMDAAILAICSRLCVRGLVARGISRSIGQRSI